MNRFLNALYPLALAAGLAGIAGAALAAARHHPVALAMTLLIAAFFAVGVWELTTFRRASRELGAALDGDDVLAKVPAGLRAAVQQRLDGLRVALPGLSLAPALAGLLVLLGMLGTFIGLVITLSSTASALGASADLAALRTALGAPVQGLGLAFSASVAGVTGSAMLGLMVALARRERVAVVALLDTALLGKLRPLTAAHRREMEQAAAQSAAAETARNNQLELVDQLKQFAQQMADRLIAQNDKFHAEAGKSYTALAASVDTTLSTSLAESARLAGAAIQPAAEAAMAGIAREAAALHERVGTQVGEQLGALSTRFEAGVAQIAQQGEAAAQAQTAGLAAQREAALQLLADTSAATQQAVDRLGQRWATEAQALLAAQADADAARAAALNTQIAALAEQRTAAQQAIVDTAERFAAQTQALLDRVAEAQARQHAAQAELDAQRRAEAQADAEALAQQRAANERLLAAQRETAQQLLADSGERAQNALTALSTGFAAQTKDLLDRIADTQTRHAALQAELDAQRRAEARADADALSEQRAANEQLLVAQREAAQQLLAASGQRAQDALTELTAGFAAQTQAAVTALADAHTQLQSAHAANDAERLATWRTELQSAGAAQLAQQQQLADGLLSHTRELVAQTEAQAKSTLHEAGVLLQAAGEAPRAAVEVVAALREQLAQSQAQDRAALAERAELMQTVSTLLASLQQAAGEQRAALDALLAGASGRVDALIGGTSSQVEVLLGGASHKVDELLQGASAQVGTLLGGAATQVETLLAGTATQVSTLMDSSATQLESLGQRFTEQTGATGQALSEAATTIAASAAEMGSLGEGFGAAVEQFQGANAQLVQHLAALEERLSAAMNRSDEQLGYYVAQAREVIDLCLGSQKQVLDALQNTAAANG